jgi:CO/xanthine dehydrogenase Mo-binding subunit
MRDTFVAIVAEVLVDRETGRVQVETVHVAQDCGRIINPDGVLNQVEGNVIQSLSRTLKEEVRNTTARVTSLDWNSYPVARFSDVPEIKVELVRRDDMPPSVVGEVASVPMAGAIANAIFDATGKRMRVAPFTPERVRACPSLFDI